MMKLSSTVVLFVAAIAVAAVSTTVHAFTAAVTTIRRQQRVMPSALRMAGDYVPMEGETKINLKIDLDSPKVATMDEIEKGECWR